MTFIYINKGLATAFIKTKLAWYCGIDAGELAGGNYALPLDVLPMVEKYNKGLATALKRFPTVEDPVFIEYDEDGNRTN